MIGGCLKNTLAMVGCATVLVVGGVAAYKYRAQITGAVRSVGGGAVVPVDGAESAVGQPSERALRAARRKQSELEASRGGYVVLSADEMASLVVDGLDPIARGALDSLRVVLTHDRFTLKASLKTRVFGRDLLGPLEGMLSDQEPLETGGPARVLSPGVAAWQPDHFQVRAFPFPGALVPRLVNRLTGRRDGAVPIAVPRAVGEIRIRPDGVTFFRRMD